MDTENLSKIEKKIYTSIQEPKSVQEIGTNSRLSTNKFSVVSENTHGFVHLTGGFISCQSGECQAIYKHCRRKAIHLHTAIDSSICPHLRIMKCHKALWERGNELTDAEEVDVEYSENSEEVLGEGENSPLVLQADDDLPKVR